MLLQHGKQFSPFTFLCALKRSLQQRHNLKPFLAVLKTVRLLLFRKPRQYLLLPSMVTAETAQSPFSQVLWFAPGPDTVAVVGIREVCALNGFSRYGAMADVG